MIAPQPDPDAAYRSWAPHYDRFMEHPAYPAWVRRLEAAAVSSPRRGTRALDVGCGTGKSTEPLLELGYEVTACDPSPAMLAQAKRRLNAHARLVAGGLPRLPRLGRFDYVSCLNDVVNHLLDEEALTAAFAALRDNLSRGGVVVFDTSTEALYRSLYSGLRWVEYERAAVLWRGETSPHFRPGELARAAVEIFTPEAGRWRRETAPHLQRHHPEPVVERALEEAGLRLYALYGQCDDGVLRQPLRSDVHTKAIHVATPLP